MMTAVPVPAVVALMVGIARPVGVALAFGFRVGVGPTVGKTGVLMPLRRKAWGSAVLATNGFGWMMRSTCKYQTLLVSGSLPQPAGPSYSRQMPSTVNVVPGAMMPKARSNPCAFNCNPSETNDQWKTGPL
jgi:hypothetical protein